jgi:hypothetical protein
VFTRGRADDPSGAICHDGAGSSSSHIDPYDVVHVDCERFQSESV